MDVRSDILTTRIFTVDDYLPLSSLSLNRAASVLPEDFRSNYEAAWRWFMSMSGTIGSRLYGERIPGVSETFSICAVRGIHVPAKSDIALSVTVKRKGIYSAIDQPLIHLPNGTWILEYAAHRNNTGGETNTRWNDGLVNCLKLGLPVGVFNQHSGSRYVRYLAYVEEYHPERRVFTLHGPVTSQTESFFSNDGLSVGPSATIEYMGGNLLIGNNSLEELEEDNRKFAAIRRAAREGQSKFRRRLMDAYDGKCACTGCGVAETLQAAHIIGYRGNRSNIVNNGLLLRADLHLLFDSSLITVNPDTFEFATSQRLEGTSYARINGRKMRLPKRSELRPNESYLSAHFDKFRQIERAS